MGAVLIAPLLPKMAENFSTEPNSAYLVPLCLTAPALCIAFTSPIVGALADRAGRKKLLLWALGLYAIFGTSPLYIHSLRGVVASRFGVGLTESFIMTCSTTLLADYFTHEDRQKWISYQQALMSVAGLVFVLTGGWLGEYGWNKPFALYSVSLLFLFLAYKNLWEPPSPRRKTHISVEFPWKRILGIGVLTIFGVIVFFSVPVELGFLLLQRGVRSSFQVGLFNAIISLPIPVGSLLFKKLHSRVPMRWLIGLPLLFLGTGLALASRAQSVAVMLCFLSIQQFGGGLMMPSFLAFAISRLSFEVRGRGTGAWWSCYFIGQFSSPLLVTFIAQHHGGLDTALFGLGLSSIVVSLIAVVLPVWAGQSAHPEPVPE